MVSSGLNTADLVFKILAKRHFRSPAGCQVRITLICQQKTTVILLSAEGRFLAALYGAKVSSDGKFTLCRVLPGKYFALVDVDSDAQDAERSPWLTRKTELVVNRNGENLALELIARHQ